MFEFYLYSGPLCKSAPAERAIHPVNGKNK